MLEAQEAAWIERAKNGDTAAFEQLVRAHEKQVYQLALRFTNHPEDAADIAQETFLRAWRSLAGFRGEAAFSTWLYRLASNQCIDYARKKNRFKRWEEPLETEDEEGVRKPLELPDMRFSPENAAEKAEFIRSVTRALEKLRPEHRMIFLLRESGGLSYAEIAGALGIEEGTVKSRLSRAREALRFCLAEYLGDKANPRRNLSRPISSKPKEKR